MKHWGSLASASQVYYHERSLSSLIDKACPAHERLTLLGPFDSVLQEDKAQFRGEPIPNTKICTRVPRIDIPTTKTDTSLHMSAFGPPNSAACSYELFAWFWPWVKV